MDIEILVDLDPCFEDKYVSFDSRDFSGKAVPRKMIAEQMELTLKSAARLDVHSQVFILHVPVGPFSITELFKMAVLASKNCLMEKIKVVVRSENVKLHLEDQIPPGEVLRQESTVRDHQIVLATGDITEVKVDAIVNASNTRLVLGAGVSGSISAKAGLSLQSEMRKIALNRQLKSGDAVVTSSHSMTTCRHIIHAATAEGSAETVRSAVRNCLTICADTNIDSIAFPALGTGTGGLDVNTCAQAMIGELLEFYRNQPSGCPPKAALFVLWTKGAFKIFSAVMHSELSRFQARHQVEGPRKKPGR
jgi:O-acetyl-ADP-ribose deacetylase (regulator of RNase III)